MMNRGRTATGSTHLLKLFWNSLLNPVQSPSFGIELVWNLFLVFAAEDLWTCANVCTMSQGQKRVRARFSNKQTLNGLQTMTIYSGTPPPGVLQFSKKSVVSDCCQRHILRAFLIVGLSEEIRGKAKHIRYQIFCSVTEQKN